MIFSHIAQPGQTAKMKRRISVKAWEKTRPPGSRTAQVQILFVGADVANPVTWFLLPQITEQRRNPAFYLTATSVSPVI